MSDRHDDFQEQLGKYRSYLRLIARLQLDPRLWKRSDPSDVVQDTLIRAWEKREQYKGDTSREFKAWLRQILATTLLTAVRKWKRPTRSIDLEESLSKGIETSSQRLEECLASDCPTPDKEAELDEELLNLANAMEMLPENERSVIEMTYFKDLTLKATAEIMEQSVSKISRLKVSGIQKLREKLGKSFWSR